MVGSPFTGELDARLSVAAVRQCHPVDQSVDLRLGTYRSDVHMEFFDDVGLLKTPAPGVRTEDVLLSPGRKGVYVDADIIVLIERVVVSPFSPIWFSDLVVSLSKRLGYAFEVVASEMSRPSPLLSLA
jgi:hypothetical protein